ncbi:MAG: hypothetical protein V4543_01205 [Bacteroidota bacterium]
MKINYILIILVLCTCLFTACGSIFGDKKKLIGNYRVTGANVPTSGINTRAAFCRISDCDDKAGTDLYFSYNLYICTKDITHSFGSSYSFQSPGDAEIAGKIESIDDTHIRITKGEMVITLEKTE